jgi:hypothetical protein
MRGERMTAAQRSLIRLIVAGGNRRHITRKDAQRMGLEPQFNVARKAGLLVDAGYECSGTADEWLDSPAGRRALVTANIAAGAAEREVV